MSGSQVAGNKSFLSSERTAIVLGGHADTVNGLAPDNSGNQVIKDPTTMGEGVPAGDLPFSLRQRSADYFAQCSTPGLLDPGKAIYARGDTSGKLAMASLVEEQWQPSASTPGNANLIGEGDFWKAITHMYKHVNRPPNMKKIMDKGAEVYQKQEKGPFSHSLLAGLPAHGAIFNLLGPKIPPEKNIPTAIQEFLKILSAAMVSNLPGTSMSTGKMFKNITDDPQKLQKVTKDMPPEIRDAFISIANIIQVVETSGTTVTDFRVHEETFNKNAVDLFCQCRTLNDLIHISMELTSNTHFHGHDKLQEIRYKANTPFGEITLHVDHTGNLRSNVSNSVTQSENSYSSTMGNSGSAQAAPPGINFFGESLKRLLAMFKRLSPSQHQQAIKQLQKLNTSSPEKIKSKLREPCCHKGGLMFDGWPK